MDANDNSDSDNDTGAIDARRQLGRRGVAGQGGEHKPIQQAGAYGLRRRVRAWVLRDAC